MTNERFIREAMLIGDEGVAALAAAKVAVFGVGGVGSYAAEALARCGVGTLELIDGDVVSVSNINRQLCALDSTVGLPKVQVMAERFRQINPALRVVARYEMFLPENAHTFDFGSYDFVIDAVDMVTAKVSLAVCCHKAGTPMISCMGTGNKQDPGALQVGDLAKTHTCPLARVMRRELKARGIVRLPVVWSEEAPMPHRMEAEETSRVVPGSLAFVPPVAGFLAASEAVKSIWNRQGERI
ncbi:MAG: tRNA threonylcarbamoyladenosine dehydratase [Clostridia bacterium]|nr:tRNA threonylcarbamoyladenosine dehydratase [Clostridia bacterium]